MWTYVLGPFLAFLPQRWRKALPFAQAIEWGPAGTISGLAEFVLAVIAGMYWYSYSVTTWVQRGVELALSGKAGAGVTDQAIGFMAYVLWAGHPLTWLIGCVFAEGAVRLCGAAFTENVLGTFPLFLVDKMYGVIFRRGAAQSTEQSNVSSLLSAVAEKVSESRTQRVSDELHLRKSATEEFLEVRASHRKADWTPPRVVRYQDSYYRLEECAKGAAPRPFRYVLRRLPAGVPGRNVLVYSPE